MSEVKLHEFHFGILRDIAENKVSLDDAGEWMRDRLVELIMRDGPQLIGVNGPSVFLTAAGGEVMASVDFVRESNLIEGITRDPTRDEIEASERFIILFQVSVVTMGLFQGVIAPGKPLRNSIGMNVRVGNHVAPAGGPKIGRALGSILHRANMDDGDPWKLHCDFETLHPYMDGNGRTGRILWAWQMYRLGRDPFALPFLHRWYYDTLGYSRTCKTRRRAGSWQTS